MASLYKKVISGKPYWYLREMGWVDGKPKMISERYVGTAADIEGHLMLPVLRKIIAEWRNRIETTFKEITDQMELARHGAHTFWGLLTRTAAIIAAHTLMRVCLAGQ